MKGRVCAKPTIELVQLNGGCGASPTFPVALLSFEYLALPQVYTFFRWRLYSMAINEMYSDSRP